VHEPTIALAFTPEAWVESLHRHFTDHGGARVRQLVMDPKVALDESYEVFVVGARWPALTAGLVGDLHDRGRRVLGVASREDRGSLDVLARVGADRVIHADATALEFLEAILLLAPDARPDASPLPAAPSALGQRVVVRGPSGSGATEIAIGLAAAWSSRRAVALVDLDDIAPSVAQRLALPIEPNIRTTIDAIEFGAGEPGEGEYGPSEFGTSAEPTASRGLRVVAGLPNPAAWAHVRAGEADRLVRTIARDRDIVVIDIAASLEEVGPAARSRHALARMAVRECDAVVAVGLATPVGLSRLVAWLADLHALDTEAPVHVVLNRAPSEAFRRRELLAELERCYRGASTTVIPDDRAVARATWEAVSVGRGKFRSALCQLAAVLDITLVAHPQQTVPEAAAAAVSAS
jgi:MinD-like ATPase involved in chromosome partitioning or flagellar assembly